MREHPQPSQLSPLLNDAAPLANGSVLLTGSVEDFDGPHGWIGKVDAAWNLSWETQLDDATLVGSTELSPLPDGGALVRGAFYKDAEPPRGERWTTRAADEWWVRIAPTGELVWRQSASFALAFPTVTAGIRGPYRLMALTPDLQLRIAVATTDGVKLIFGGLDGTSEVRALDTTVADVRSLVALPDGGLALAGNDATGRPDIALLNPDGSLVWERSYGFIDAHGGGTWLDAFAFNAARNELVVVGSVGSGSWMLALDLAGEPVWQLERAPSPTNIDGDVLRVEAGEGPELTDVAVAPDGSLLATGFSNRGLVTFMVGAGSCGD
ncbi:MAG: hypothetical protein ABUL60_25010 [Myxococcales bacterium]